MSLCQSLCIYGGSLHISSSAEALVGSAITPLVDLGFAESERSSSNNGNDYNIYSNLYSGSGSKELKITIV